MKQPRSPKYPVLDVEAAEEKLRIALDVYGQKPIHRGDLIAAWGFTSESGKAMRTVAVLTYYGFLKKEAKGQVRITERGMDVLHGEPHLRSAALNQAFIEPPIFAAIMDKHQNPKVEVLDRFLRREGYSANAAKMVASTFMKGFEYVRRLAEGFDSHCSDAKNERLETPIAEEPEQKNDFIEGEYKVIDDDATYEKFRVVLRGSASPEKEFFISATDRLDLVDYEQIKKHIDVEMEALACSDRLPCPKG